MIKKLCFFFSLLVVFWKTASAQQHLADSIEKILLQNLSDSARAKAMLLRGMYYEKIDSLKPHILYKEVVDFAGSKKMDLYISKGYYYDGYFYNLQGNCPMALEKIKRAISIIEHQDGAPYQKEYLKQMISLSGAYLEIGDQKNAIAVYLKLIDRKEKTGKILPSDYANVGQIYQRMDEFDEMKKWFSKAIALAKEQKSEYELFRSYLDMTLYYSGIGDYVTAKKINDTARFMHFVPYNSIAKIDNPDNAYYVFQLYYLTTASAFQDIKQYDSAIYFYQMAYNFARENKVERDYIVPDLKLGNIYLLKKNYLLAEPLLKRALASATKGKNTKQMEEANQSLSLLYEATQHYNEALNYFKAFYYLHDSVAGADKKKYAQELEARYESEKKDARILYQNDSLQKKNLLNYLFAGAALSLLVIILLLYLNYKKHKKIQLQQITELQNEKTISVTKSLLEGEEKERSRIAKDLHDGLSGMLSGVKFSLQNMKGNLIMDNENKESFTRSLDMLDSSIAEMRRVAHNMMPEVLVKFGLNAALKDYISDVNKSGAVSFVYQSMGMEEKYSDQNMALAVFRIIQELINNVIKHSGASRALVQVLHENNKLLISVEDNGKGMPSLHDLQTSGMGWKNIQSRVALLKGKLEVQAHEGNGTVINIEFNVV